MDLEMFPKTYFSKTYFAGRYFSPIFGGVAKVVAGISMAIKKFTPVSSFNALERIVRFPHVFKKNPRD